MTPLEQKELRGITLRLVWTIIFSAAASIGLAVRLYFNIITAIQDNKTDYRVQDQRIDYAERSIARNAADIELLKYKLKPAAAGKPGLQP